MHFPPNRAGNCAFNGTNVVRDLFGHPQVLQSDAYRASPPDGRAWLEPPQIINLYPRETKPRLCALSRNSSVDEALAGWPVSEFLNIGVGWRCFARAGRNLSCQYTDPAMLWGVHVHNDTERFVDSEVAPTLQRGIPFLFDNGFHVRTLLPAPDGAVYVYDDIAVPRVSKVTDVASFLRGIGGEIIMGVACAGKPQVERKERIGRAVLSYCRA